MFLPAYTFKKSWRSYQQDVLDSLGGYLDDKHVHIVAAPGSGKTVLGLEIIRRLERPSLVFAPTRPIREQWVNRLQADFLPAGCDTDWVSTDWVSTDWVSTDLLNPKYLTVSTYQALSSCFRSDEGIKELKALIIRHQIQVIVVDEAHHLRANWWKCLESVKSFINDPTIVSLTATPPIDVSQVEWNRYSSFCGKVDIEVNIPELVKSGTLCPHQDFVYLSQPTPTELEVIEGFHSQVQRCLRDFQLDEVLARALINSSNEWIRESDGKAHLRHNQMFYIALCIFTRNAVADMPVNVVNHYELSSYELPTELPLELAQILWQGLCFQLSDRMSYEAFELFKEYKELLYHIGAVEKKHVTVQGKKQIQDLLKRSPGKLHSITEIIDHELTELKEGLRAVILADFIRLEALNTHLRITDAQVKIGVAPIFELLRRMTLKGLSLAMLTGKCVIVPVSLQEAIKVKGEQYQVYEIEFILLAQDEEYCEVKVRNGDEHKLVLLISELFDTGELNCLVGTAALLGEGWDAPAVNTLVLATYVGSYVMSNQMRGRTIRTNSKRPDKVSNIWHLASVLPNRSDGYEGKDFLSLKRRFDHFYGVVKRDGEVRVESGIQRIGAIDFSDVKNYNQRVLSLSEHREETSELWKRVFIDIPEGRFYRPIKEVIIPTSVTESKFILRVSGKKESGFRYRIGQHLKEKRMTTLATSLAILLGKEGEISTPSPEALVKVDVRGRKVSVSLATTDMRDQLTFLESLNDCFNPYYLADWFLVKGDEFLMIPKSISKKAKVFSHLLKSAGYRKYRLLSSASVAGQEALIRLRNSYILNEKPIVKISMKTGWGDVGA